jgi:hypothetical protein
MEKKKKDPVPKEHWEIMYSTNEPSKILKGNGGADFNPKRSTERKTTYVKVNEQDH